MRQTEMITVNLNTKEIIMTFKWNCEKCSREVEMGDKFCKHCGAKAELLTFTKEREIEVIPAPVVRRAIMSPINLVHKMDFVVEDNTLFKNRRLSDAEASNLKRAIQEICARYGVRAETILIGGNIGTIK